MLITDVRAHHIRIPYDAGVASFRQGASAIAALDIVLVEVSTDAGITGWGDAFAYVSPRTTATAVEEMIAPQARGLEVPDAAKIPAFMEQVQRNLHLFGRYGITMFAISGLDIALWDIAAKVKGVPLLMRACSESESPNRSRASAGPRGGSVTPRSSCTRPRRRRCLRRARRSAMAFH